jgi:hypothetical protein
MGIYDLGIRFLMAVLGAFYATTMIAKIWECIPRRRIWDKSVPGTCVNVGVLLDISGAFNTLTDIVILALSIAGVWNLHVSSMKKLGVVLGLTVGFMYVF